MKCSDKWLRKQIEKKAFPIKECYDANAIVVEISQIEGLLDEREKELQELRHKIEWFPNNHEESARHKGMVYQIKEILGE